MREMQRELPQEVPHLIASIPASAQHRRIALGVVIFLAGVFALVIPFAHMQTARIDAFIPVVQTIIFFADLITAVFLFAQYTIQPQRALLALASGYIFSGVFAFLQTLDFPGAYSATGLISGKPSGSSTLDIECFGFRWLMSMNRSTTSFTAYTSSSLNLASPPRGEVGSACGAGWGDPNYFSSSKPSPAKSLSPTRQPRFAVLPTSPRSGEAKLATSPPGGEVGSACGARVGGPELLQQF